MHYKNSYIPDSYYCHHCRAVGLKLWRQFYEKLLCAQCAVENQSRPGISLAVNKDVWIENDGTYLDKDGIRTSQIGWFVPAIPDEEEIGYYGYDSGPVDGWRWWRNLPTRKEQAWSYMSIVSNSAILINHVI